MRTFFVVFYRYYDQLVANESKFPIAENSIRIDFKWQDAFDKESFFSGKRTLSKSLMPLCQKKPTRGLWV